MPSRKQLRTKAPLSRWFPLLVHYKQELETYSKKIEKIPENLKVPTRLWMPGRGGREPLEIGDRKYGHNLEVKEKPGVPTNALPRDILYRFLYFLACLLARHRLAVWGRCVVLYNLGICSCGRRGRYGIDGVSTSTHVWWSGDKTRVTKR